MSWWKRLRLRLGRPDRALRAQVKNEVMFHAAQRLSSVELRLAALEAEVVSLRRGRRSA